MLEDPHDGPDFLPGELFGVLNCLGLEGESVLESFGVAGFVEVGEILGLVLLEKIHKIMGELVVNWLTIPYNN